MSSCGTRRSCDTVCGHGFVGLCVCVCYDLLCVCLCVFGLGHAAVTGAALIVADGCRQTQTYILLCIEQKEEESKKKKNGVSSVLIANLSLQFFCCCLFFGILPHFSVAQCPPDIMLNIW